MIPSEYLPMLDKLEAKTKTKKNIWKTTSDSEKFILDIGNNAVVVQKYSAFPGDSLIVEFEIVSCVGEKIDGFYVSEEEEGFERLFRFYDAAKRNALRIDETISKIIRDIDLYL